MSMISHQIDELRELAKGLRMLDYPKDAQKVDSAIDTIEALSEKVADQNLNRSEIPKSENPCGKCQMSLMEKSTCCGCPERIEWEKQCKQNIPSATSQNLTETNKNCEVDLISRQAALDEIDDVSDVCEEIGQIEWCAELRTRVISLPPADRPTGKWDKNGNCTNCGEHAPYWAMATTYYRSNYCPNCGAEMKGENK